ncbi:GPN-loop GTPase 2 [Thecamonas trahens ATCC 50062]|uniref:GPN-loop GTPase 2 n=1 Tax=Thecamonas trahens ATCC 50062 TaxID=461836 RepID=A0A0L0DRF8_THETB|nr:GPN-loop GTPase 2 [Thecamonas trahens ATCC 50062]KNC54033.1 GPN-loop GTPase 2 [Thecamonas trahens ATCC 50062]|eukprot:XP_013754046.1 GPN-loop GTPase 2 [Thecamonas trahens ATCC 50062]
MTIDDESDTTSGHLVQLLNLVDLVVIGPPGCGKTTYCAGVEQFLNSSGRVTIVVNLDPANFTMAYTPAVDIAELVQLDVVMEEEGLGPNGGLIYCIEYLEANLDWLEEKLAEAIRSAEAAAAAAAAEAMADPTAMLQNMASVEAGTSAGAALKPYVLFDCPGQVELYTHNQSMRNILATLTQGWNMRLCAVHLVDAAYCTDPSKYISVLLTSLATMVQLELPHVNVLSKMDLIESLGKLDFNLEFYLDVLNLEYLVDLIDEREGQASKYRALTSALADLVSGFGLVAFVPLNISDAASVGTVLKVVDKANGYVFGGLERSNDGIFGVAASPLYRSEYERTTLELEKARATAGVVDDDEAEIAALLASYAAEKGSPPPASE